MDILNKPINTFTFQDVVSFCQEGYREGIQLDYKRELPRDGLSKFIAAFSNTRGGVILIGVEENRTTGVPSAWNGIPNNAHNIEQIHQWASDVEPVPLYEVYSTNEVHGNVFILVRIFEGDRTPYYVQNDPRIYVRTGNITPSIDLASPDATELLINKKEKAQLLRTVKIKQSNEIYESSLRRAERERKQKIAIERANHERAKREAISTHQPIPDFQSKYIPFELGTNTSILTIILQPFNPKAFVVPKEIKERLMEIRDGDRTFNIGFPSLNVEPIPEGVMSFSWGENDGSLHCEQLYSSGLIRLSKDVMDANRDTGYKYIYISHIVSLTFAVMKAATHFYKLFGYQGGIKGFLSLDSAEGVFIKPILTGRETFPDDEKAGLLPHYNHPLDTDTALLNDNRLFQEYYIRLIEELFWMFGYEHPHPDTIKAYLEGHHWYVT